MTLTRVGGFTGNVVVAATSLPTGVTVSSQTISGAATTATLTIAVASSATAVTVAAVSITATGTGVAIAPQSYSLTVTVPITQIGTDITNLELGFGSAMALSADGTRLVVAANGSLNGTTRVYQRSGTAWTQLGSDVVGEAAGDFSGTGVDINAAGTRIAVGSYTNSGNGNSAGHVRVFDLIGSTWTQVGADIDGNLVFVSFGTGLGWRVALSASGNRLIAGAPIRNVLGGFARVYDLIGGNWTQVGADLTGTNEFGDDVDISSDGNTVAVSSPFVPSSGGPGSVQVYRLSGANWAQVGNVLTGITTTPGIAENFGDAISLSANGTRIAVGAPQIVAGAPGGFRGQVRVFDLVGSTWTQVGSSVTGMDLGGTGDKFGSDLMISDDGTRFAASARETARGRVYTLIAGAWVQTGADIRSTGGSDSEGIALSPDGKTVAIGSTNGRRVSVFSITP